MFLKWVQARYKKIHEKAPYHDGTFRIWDKERTTITPFHYDEGVHLWLSREDLSPDDDFLEQGTRRES